MPKPSSSKRPSELQQVNVDIINLLLALRDGSNYVGAPSETLMMPREKMDIILEVVNTEALLEELEAVYTAEQYQKMVAEMRRVIPDLDSTKIVQSDQEFSHVNALRKSHEKRDEKNALTARRKAAEKLHKTIEKNQAARRQAQNQPITVRIPIQGPMNIEQFITTMREVDLQFSNENIARGMDPKAAKAQVLSNEALEELYQILTRVFGIENVSGDTALNEFQFTRFSDGSMNIIANSSLYNGMVLRPHDQFQAMKEQGEQQRMFIYTLFAKGPEGMTQAREAAVAPPTTPTPFKTQCTPPVDGK